MQHEYISLGSACDIAMILKKLGLKKNKYPFDWLWNQDSGLAAVNEMVENNFNKVVSNNSYCERKHYRLNDPLIIAYKHYPSIIHMHSDPLHDSKDHDNMLSRIESFEKLMTSNKKIHFIYYRNHYEDTLKKPNTTPQETLNRLIEEGSAFLNIIDKKYPAISKRVSILLVHQTNIEHRRDRVAYYIPDKRIQIGFTISKYEENKKLHKLWEKLWIREILLKTKMPPYLIIKSFFYHLCKINKFWKRTLDE